MRRKAEGTEISMKSLIDEWKGLLAMQKDVHACLSCDEGDGKSHLGITLVRRLGGNLWDNVVYSRSPEEFFQKYDKLKEGQPIFLDEALHILDKTDWQRAELKKIVKLVRGDARKEKRAIFLYAVQGFSFLHSYFRNHRIRYLIELPQREWFSSPVNYGYVFRRTRQPFLTGRRDSWLMDRNEKDWIETQKRGPHTGGSYIERLRAHTFYIGEFQVKPLSPVLESEYLKNRERAIREFPTTDYDSKSVMADKYRGYLSALLYRLNEGIYMEGQRIRFTQEVLAKQLKVKRPQVNRWITKYKSELKR